MPKTQHVPNFVSDHAPRFASIDVHHIDVSVFGAIIGRLFPHADTIAGAEVWSFGNEFNVVVTFPISRPGQLPESNACALSLSPFRHCALNERLIISSRIVQNIAHHIGLDAVPPSLRFTFNVVRHDGCDVVGTSVQKVCGRSNNNVPLDDSLTVDIFKRHGIGPAICFVFNAVRLIGGAKFLLLGAVRVLLSSQSLIRTGDADQQNRDPKRLRYSLAHSVPPLLAFGSEYALG